MLSYIYIYRHSRAYENVDTHKQSRHKNHKRFLKILKTYKLNKIFNYSTIENKRMERFYKRGPCDFALRSDLMKTVNTGIQNIGIYMRKYEKYN